MLRRDPFAAAKRIAPPRVRRKSVRIKQHGKARTDPYAWLRAANWRDVLSDPGQLPEEIREALNAENGYYAAVTGDLEELRIAISREMRGRLKEDDLSVPSPDGPWRYWIEFRKGGEYPIYKRGPRGGGQAQTLFDADRERGESAYFNVGGVRHSPDHRLYAYATDRVGSENYEIRVRDLETGAEKDAVIRNASGAGAVWAAGSDAFFYIERDVYQRPKRVKLHKLGETAAFDRIVYEERDDGFFLTVSETQSGTYILIESHNHSTSEVRVLPANAPDSEPVLIAPREDGVEYSVEHRGDQFYILTNADDATDFKIVTAPVSAPGRENWRDLAPHATGSFISRLIVYERFMVRLERRDALPRIVVTDLDGQSHSILFDEAAFAVGVNAGYEADTQILRFSYASPSTPTEIYDYDMASRARSLLKTQEIPSGHDKSLYVVERVDARARDGELVPVTILRLAKTRLNGRAPLLLYGYGAYGLTVPADFSTNALSLVDRGMVYAIAHVRGGSERGRQWHLDGKRHRKVNSVSDFIAAAEALIRKRYTAVGRIVAYGGSAGGLLVGAALNKRPELFGAVIAAVPFVDVLNTISDESLPLTPPEWPEWGNPVDDPKEYGWIAAYSPYDNIRARPYPPVMATGGIADSRVTYWEPAKWIARLRAVAKRGPFALRMNMEAGHGGAAARFKRMEELAHLYAFALKAVGRDSAMPPQRGRR